MPEISILLTLGTIAVLFVFFAKQVATVELLALGAVSFLLLTGILTTGDFLTVFSNPAAMTVAAMFILSGALEKTGVIDYLGRMTLALSARSNILAFSTIFTFVFFSSFFINNTSVVLIMIPVVIALAHNISLPASKILIPLSYFSILGGACTLIGTSTNLLVDGVARTMGVEHFGMFEILTPGLIMALVGGLYLLLIGNRLLPARRSLSEFFEQEFKRQFITQVYVGVESGLSGKTLKEAGFTPEAGYEIVQLIRKNAEAQKTRLSRFLGSSDIAHIFRTKIESKNYSASAIDLNEILEEGDRLVMMTGQRQILHQQQKKEAAEKAENQEQPPAHIDFTQSLNEEDFAEDQAVTMEGIVAPNSNFIGRYIHELRLGDIYDVHILAVHRRRGRISNDFDMIQLNVGDTLLLKGRESELKRIFDNDELLSLSKPAQEPYNYKKAPIALLAIAGAVAAAAFGILPIAGSAFIAAVLVVLAGCIKNNDAYKALHGEVLLLIYAMLALSVAMEKTGALQFIVGGAMSIVNDLPPIVVISVLYLFTSLLTEIFSNNAAAVMLTPVAIGLAQQMGLDPKAFAAAIMFGASASFATPIGYQTNTLVFNAGGYKFNDFLRIGLPMNIIMWITASLVIPWHWGLL